MAISDEGLKKLEPFLRPDERARVAENLVYWRRKKRLSRRFVAEKIISEQALMAYEDDSSDMPLKDILALANRLCVPGAALTDKRDDET